MTVTEASTSVTRKPFPHRSVAPGGRGRSTLTQAAAIVILGLVVIFGTLGIGGQAISDFVVMAAIYAVMAVGYDVTIGMSRQFALGANGSVAIGAYGAGILALHATVNPWLGALLAVALGAVLALATALLAYRVREFYFAVLTLAVGLSVQSLAFAWQQVTGGAAGLVAVPGLGESRLVAPDYTVWVPLTVGSVALLVIAGIVLRNGSLGRAFRAVARDEELAQAFGLSVGAHRALAMTISGGVLGYGGFLLARYVQFVVPDSFSIALTVTLVLMVYLGGKASIWGAAVGAIAVRGITTGLQTHGEVANLALAAILVLVLAVFGDGLAGGVNFLSRYFRRMRTRS